MKKVCIVINSTDLNRDDRIRKLFLTFSSHVLIECFSFCETEKIYYTNYGMKVQNISLVTRRFFKGGRALFLKAVESSIVTFFRTRRFDKVILCEEFVLLSGLFIDKSRLILDLHETPGFYMRNAISTFVFKLIASKSSLVIHASEARLKFVNEYFDLDGINAMSLYNFPEIPKEEKISVYESLRSRIGLRNYAYIQGIWSTSRHPINTIGSVLEATDLHICVVGGIEPDVKRNLRELYKDTFDKRVIDIGKIDQEQIFSLVRHAKLTIVLYRNSSMNNWLCAPNRFYYALYYNIPVVVGQNPGFETKKWLHKNIFETSDDGENMKALIDTVKRASQVKKAKPSYRPTWRDNNFSPMIKRL